MKIPFIIYEIQVASDGTAAYLPPIDTCDENEAWSVYYTKLAAAAVSSVPVHTVMLVLADGRMVQAKSFMH